MELSFEAQIALQRLVIPGAIGVAGGYVLSRSQAGLSSILGSLLIGAGLIVSDLWQRGLIANPASWTGWDAREPWMWMVWMISASMVLFAIVRHGGWRSLECVGWSWPSLVGIAAAVMWVVLPQGAGYEDRLRDAVRWMAIGTVAAVWNGSALDGIARHPGGRWSTCVLLAQLGCIAGLILQSYASLGEWVLAAIGVTLGLTVVGLWIPTEETTHFGWPMAPAVLGLTILGAASLAVSTFYVSTPAPQWMIASVLFLPSIVGLVDAFLRSWNPWWRALIAALIAAVPLAAVLFQAMNHQPAW